MKRIFNSLRARIIALVIVFCVLVSAIFAGVINYAYTGYYDELRQRQGSEFARNIASMYPQFGEFDKLDRADIETMFEKMLLLDPRSAIYLLDSNGRIRAGYTKERSIGSKANVALEPIERLLKTPVGQTVLGDDPEFSARQSLFAAAPLAGASGDAKTVGYIYVLMRPPDADVKRSLISSYANRSAFAVALGGALAGALLVFAVLSLITRPLKRLTNAADAVSAQDADGALNLNVLPHDDDELRTDEIGRVSRAFRAMVMRLREQAQQVKRVDANRREWVANVSHDLRTPLTSLIGHLETIQMRGERMSAEDRVRFLDVAMRNAQHLDRLSSSLFDLARLESDDLPLDKSPAHLGEFLDDFVARFAAVAETRNITLTVEYPPGLPLVSIDAALVERALANLMDNALRYTPSGGAIMLNAAPRDNGVAVTVADSGKGIDATVLAHVFERFFQGSSHREGGGHAGLGLAVVERVAQLHGGRASAANRESGGAVFELWFPLS